MAAWQRAAARLRVVNKRQQVAAEQWMGDPAGLGDGEEEDDEEDEEDEEDGEEEQEEEEQEQV